MAQKIPHEQINRFQNQAEKGNYLKLPSTLMQAYAMKTTPHTGMHMVEMSIEAQRACNEAIIFVYGLSGHGKSQSLNHLFGFDLIPIGKLKKASDTKSVTEYIANLVSDSWEVQNMEIGFIDPPGWGDTQGDLQDARNIAAIEQFIENHPHLGSRIYKCYPSIILIAVNANDKRLDGADSGLCKMLIALRHLDIVDKKRPNIIFILTHIMGLPPGNFAEEIDEISKIIKKNCRRHLDVDPVVVCLENKPELYLLEKEGDWSVLPDGKRQPLNLFNAMIKQMTSNGDEIGVEAVRVYFPNRGESQPRTGATLHADQVKLEREQKWMRIITQKNKNIIEDECIRAIRKYQRENKQIHRDTFNPLMIQFNAARINRKQDLKGRDIVEVQEMMWPLILGSIEKDMIICQFEVKPVQYPEILLALNMGLFRDNPGRDPLKPIFKYAPAHVQHGVMLPSCLSLRYNELTQVICTCVTDNRARNFVASSSFMCFERSQRSVQLTGSRTNIYNIVSEIKKHKFEFSIIHNIFRIDLQLKKKLLQYVTADFKEAIKHLPDPYANPSSENYSQFIDNYGNCFRTMLEGGGIVSGEIELEIPEENIMQIEMLIKNHIQIYLTTMRRDEEQEDRLVQDENSKMVLNELFTCQLKWNGGTVPDLYENNLNALNQEDFGRWKRSLHRNPICVDKMYSVSETKHINELVSEFDRPKASMIHQSLVHGTVDNFGANNIEFNVSACFGLLKSSDDGRRDTIGEEPPELPELEIVVQQPPPQIDVKISPQGSEEIRTITRSQAARNHTPISGFPNQAKIRRKRNIAQREPEEVQIDQVEVGDFVLCVDEYFQHVYDEVVEVCRNTEYFSYHRLGYGHHRHMIAGKKCCVVNAQRKQKKVEKALVRDRVSIITNDEYRMKEYEIASIRICNLQGNVRLKVKNREDLYLIVDDMVMGESSCFPGNASVTLKGGEKVRMDEVKIGDYVLSIHPSTGKPVYSKVYLWAHRDPHVTATFLHITHPHGHLHISANHLILSGEQRRPVPAGHLAVGDTIHSLLSPDATATATATATAISVPVLHIHTCTQVGYYAPFTNNGLIVVDGIASSVYSQPSTRSHAHVCASVTGGLVEQFGLHRVGECVMTPVRVGCKLGVGSLILTKQMDTTTHIHKYCQWLMKIYEHFM